MIVILGIGNELNGDDGVGPYVVKNIKETDDRKVINASTAPENFFGKIDQLKPERLIIVDAVNFGGKPGETRIIETDKLEKDTKTTHNMSIRFLTDLLNIKTTFIGIQIKQNEFESELSSEIKEAADDLIKKINSGSAIS